MALLAIGLVPMALGSAAIGWVPSADESFFVAYLLGLLVALLGAIVLGTRCFGATLCRVQRRGS